MPELVVSWLVIGAVAGSLVFLFSSRRAPGGVFGNLAAGIAGALIGGYLVTVATHADVARAALTWGILATSLLSALVLGIIIQSQSTPRAHKAAKGGRKPTGP